MTERVLRSLASNSTAAPALVLGKPASLIIGEPVAASEARQRKPRAPRQSPEARVVDEITQAAKALGYEVARVGQSIARGSGTTAGFPDLTIRHPHWPRSIMAGVEVKTKAGKLSAAQQAMLDAGWIVVARCAADALKHLRVCELAIGDPGQARRIETVLKQMGDATR